MVNPTKRPQTFDEAGDKAGVLYGDSPKDRFRRAMMKVLRKEGILQVELAHRLGVSKSCVCKWMSGKSKPDFRNSIMLWKKYPYIRKLLEAK